VTKALTHTHDGNPIITKKKGFQESNREFFFETFQSPLRSNVPVGIEYYFAT
jgi:hypothetical protein